MITNGGYTGVTMALAHGVPIVQAGTTEEKAEIAARIEWSGAGVRLGKTHPLSSALAAAIDRVRTEPSFGTRGGLHPGRDGQARRWVGRR